MEEVNSEVIRVCAAPDEEDGAAEVANSALLDKPGQKMVTVGSPDFCNRW